MSQYELPNPPSDGITAVQFAPKSSHRLLVSSWDKSTYLYDTENGGQLLKQFESPAAVLDVTFGADDEEAYIGGLEWDVRR